MNKKIKNNEGFALLMSLIISSVALAIGLSMLEMTMKQLSLGTTTKGSEVAFQAANAGMECLQYTRNSKSVNFTTGDPSPTVDCFGPPVPPIYSSPALGIYQYNYSDITFNTSSGNNRCIDIEMYIFDATTGAKTRQVQGVSKTCATGDICTYGSVRGYNRSCAEITGSIFAVQRELTIEF